MDAGSLPRTVSTIFFTAAAVHSGWSRSALFVPMRITHRPGVDAVEFAVFKTPEQVAGLVPADVPKFAGWSGANLSQLVSP